MTSPQWLAIVLIWLATYRITILVTEDRIAQPVVDPIQNFFERRWAAKHPDRVDPASEQWQSPIGFLLSCPWCLSVWVGGIVTVLVDAWFSPLPLPALVALSASGVTGFLATVAGEH